MGMTYTFKDANGDMVFSIEGVNAVTDNEVSLESMYSNIVSSSKKIDNALEKFSFVSDTRAMEAFGYMATEGFKDNIKKVGHNIWEKISKFFNDIIKFFKGVLAKINNKINSNAAKRAAAEVLKNMTNPSDKDSAVELAKITSIIESDNMGLYVVLKKNRDALIKIKNLISTTKGNPSDKDLFKGKADAFKSKLVEFESAAGHVSSSEKRKEAIAFYKEMSINGTTKLSGDVERELKDLETTANMATKAWKSLDQRHIDEGDDHDTNVIVAQYHLITSYYRLMTKYVQVINSLTAAAIGAKNEVLTGQDKD